MTLQAADRRTHLALVKLETRLELVKNMEDISLLMKERKKSLQPKHGLQSSSLHLRDYLIMKNDLLASALLCLIVSHSCSLVSSSRPVICSL